MTQTTKLVIIGFGSQAKAWALNLKDSGYKVSIALRIDSPSIEIANELGFATLALQGQELSEFSTILMLAPDNSQLQILQDNQSVIRKDARIVYAHGFSVCAHKLNELFPDWSHLLLAPKAIASEVRFRYQTKGKIGSVYNTEFSRQPEQDKSYLLQLAADLGFNAGPYFGSFQDETYADLFSEQSLLCSLIPYGALNSYNKLRERGISKEIAYLECWFEVKLIADAMVQMGPEKFFQLISPNALAGGEKAQQLLFDKAYREKLDSLLNDIWQGDFTTECEKTDFETLRKNVLEFWRQNELSETHKQMAGELY
jgi:ketol-acid reductoisomerase